LITASLGFKIAAVPFHLWVPDVYQGAPTPVTAYLAIGSKAAGFAAFVRLLLTVFIPVEDKLTIVLSVLAGLTMFYGNLGAIPQTNIKRLLGYSSIGHAGYLLIGLAAFSHSGKEALLFYLLSYLISTAGAFLVIIALSRHLKTEEISEFAGLSQKSPLLAAGMLLSLLSLAGLPPLAGFFAKFYILWASVKAGLLWLAFIGIVNVAPSLYYYLKVVKAMYVDKPGQGAPIRVTLDQKMIQYFCIFGILLLGVYQGPFVKLAEAAFSALSK
jgi:NADH-quinone oxidoreductase subunit N